MRLQVIAARVWSVVAICDDRGACQVQSFLDDLAHEAYDDFRQVAALIERSAACGPPRNTKKSNPLGNELFEFKTRGGIRIPYFYDEGRLIICTQALRKPKKSELRIVIKRAQRDRERYLAAKRRSEITIIDLEAGR